jgi:hypothetical protein
MDFKTTAQSGNSYSHMWDVSSMKMFDGGFALDKTNLPAGLTKLPKGVFLKADHTERTAKLIKTAVLYEAITTDSTAVKIKKGALLVATDVLGTGAKAVTVGTIDTSNAAYDSFAITAGALGALAEGAMLQTYDSAGASGKSAINPDGLNPFEVEIDTYPTCSIMFRADGVVTSRLPQAATAAIKSALPNVQFLTL